MAKFAVAGVASKLPSDALASMLAVPAVKVQLCRSMTAVYTLVGPAGWTVGQKPAVKENTIKGGTGGTQQHVVLCRCLKAGTKADEEVLLGLAAFGPNRLGRDERRPRSSEIRAHQQ